MPKLKLKKYFVFTLLCLLTLLSKGQSLITSIKTKNIEVTQRIKLRSINVDSIIVAGDPTLSDNKKLVSKRYVDMRSSGADSAIYKTVYQASLDSLNFENKKLNKNDSLIFTSTYKNTLNVKYKDTLNGYVGSGPTTFGAGIAFGAPNFTTGIAQLNVNLLNKVNNSNNGGIQINYHPTVYSNNYGAGDQGFDYTGGFSPRKIAIKSPPYYYNIEGRRGFPNSVDTINFGYKLADNPLDSFLLKFNSGIENNFIKGTKAFLIDKYLAPSIKIDISTSLFDINTPYFYTFYVDQSITASYRDRFTVLIYPAPPVVATPFYTNRNLNLNGEVKINDTSSVSGYVLTNQGPGVTPRWMPGGGSGGGAITDTALIKTIASDTAQGLRILIAGKQNQLNGTGFVKATGTTISYDNSNYLTTSSAAATYQTVQPILQTILAGTTATLTDATTWVLVNPASALSNLTVTLPATPINGQTIKFNFGGTVTSGTIITNLIVVANSGQTLNGNGIYGIIDVEDVIGFKWNSSNSKWYKL